MVESKTLEISKTKYICKKCGKKARTVLTSYGSYRECLSCGNFEASTTREALRFKRV